MYKFLGIVLISLLVIAGDWGIAKGLELTDFGPYKGKVVDADTKEPIEGVVILVEWDQPHSQILKGGTTFIDAQETVTDPNGEFYISGIWVFNPLGRISADMDIYIYKSGYQAIETSAWRKWKIFDTSFEYVLKVEDGKPVFLLKRLLPEERNKYLGPSVSYKIPCNKWKLLREEINKENIFRRFKEEVCSD